MKKYCKIIIVSIILFFTNLSLYSQLTINNTGYTIPQLVDGVLVPSASGTVISNVQFKGVYNNSSRYQVGYFSTTGTTASQMGFTNGVVLSTGNTSDIPLTLGSNPGNVAQMSTGYSSGTTGEIRQSGTSATYIQDLDILAGAQNYYNAVILEFDFIPVDNIVKFRYIFGSEEYADGTNFINYNCSSYNDKFGFLISGPGISGGQGFTNDARNIARLGNGSEVSINSVNNGVVGSSGGAASPTNCSTVNSSWVQNSPTAEFLGFIDGTELNGNTRILTATQSGLTPGLTYHIKLIVSDVNDGAYDSVVYIEAGSFTTETTCNAGVDQTLCNTSTSTLSAVTPASGTWTLISGSGSIISPTSATSSVTGLAVGNNVFRWTAQDNSCFDEVIITVNPSTTPLFVPVSSICSGGTLSALPITSTNGINGTWSPALNNTATTTYTFTPSAGQCATATTLTITVNPNVTPTFTAVAPICAGATLSALPITSTNGINGTWSPALNNTATTTYTFTPIAGQCATNTTLTISVNPNITPTFDSITPICAGSTLSALPTTSTNGINGTWSPALNNAVTTTYTFTPAAGQCATTTTLTITVIPNVTPTFSAVASICAGSSLSPLPTTSTNGINGTWLPALNNLATTTYTFTPNAGQCATTTTLTITVIPNVTPTFAAVAPICEGSSLAPLPTTSTNGINGTWSPAINNTATTIYTFTPTAGQCATTTTLTITVNPNQILNITCGASTPTSVTFNWNSLTGISNYNYTYTINSVSPTSGTLTAATTSLLINSGIVAGDNVSLTLTPIGGTCSFPSTSNCVASNCPNPIVNSVSDIITCENTPISSINFTSPSSGVTFNWTNNNPSIGLGASGSGSIPSFIASNVTNNQVAIINVTATDGICVGPTTTFTITVNNQVTPTFNSIAPICEGETLSALPTISTNGINGTWSPALNNTATTIYTFTPNIGECATTTTITITVNPNNAPTFNSVSPICAGETLVPLPTTSLNGINGTWSPSLNNAATTTYTFTPDAGQCATSTTLTIVVNANISPSFTAVSAKCFGETIPDLPLVSNNGISGVWTPAINNTATTTYTFTPNAGQCALSTTLEIVINTIITPTFPTVAAICEGATLNPLPLVSNEGISGTWSPVLNNTITESYTFTPNSGQCATNAVITITVNPNITPLFNSVAPICAGETLSALPTISTNGINGTWSPALNNLATTIYTFTPISGQCATATFLTITVNPREIPVFNPVAPVCSGENLADLPLLSNNGITGTWSPAINNTETTTYTFTPDAGQCASSSSLEIIVNELPDVTIESGCVDLMFELTAQSTTSGVTYEWLDATSNTIGNTQTIQITSAGTYEVIVTSGNCSQSSIITIDNVFCSIPKGVSPNDDGLNDTWDLSNLNIEKAQIFNRYGVEVYSKSDYTNEWEGKTNSGDELPSATYYYVLTFSSGEVKTGWVYINREN